MWNVSCLFHREKHKRTAVKMYWTSSPCTTKNKTLCSYVFFMSCRFIKRSCCVQNPALMLLRTKPWVQIHPEKSAGILLVMFSIPPLSYILNSMIWLCEPASAQKTGLEHNIFLLVVQCDPSSLLPRHDNATYTAVSIYQSINNKVAAHIKCMEFIHFRLMDKFHTWWGQLYCS